MKMNSVHGEFLGVIDVVEFSISWALSTACIHNCTYTYTLCASSRLLLLLLLQTAAAAAFTTATCAIFTFCLNFKQLIFLQLLHDYGGRGYYDKRQDDTALRADDRNAS